MRKVAADALLVPVGRFCLVPWFVPCPAFAPVSRSFALLYVMGDFFSHLRGPVVFCIAV